MSPPEPRAPEARARVLAGRAPWALHALLDGLREGDDAAARATSLAELRDALVIVVARVVFLTLARARGLVEPTIDPAGLLRGLESGAARGGWATLASWSRAQHERRGGALFDPARTSSIDAAQLPDDSVARALRAILTDETGDDASAALPVEHLGAVYEHLRGWSLARCAGPALALGPWRVVVELAAVLARPPRRRATWLCKQIGLDALPRATRAALASAGSPAALTRALRGCASLDAARSPAGAPRPVLDPRLRDAGAHYTPRALTTKIVARTLAPVLSPLAPAPARARVLALRVCDPAAGCGALLLATLRALSAALGTSASARADRVAIAERCLHGVDLDPLALRIAALSLWLECAADTRPFTFVDHGLRVGDALIGVTAAELARVVESEELGWTRADPAGARVVGDALIAARFDGTRGPSRVELRRRELELRARAAALRRGDEEARASLRRAFTETRARCPHALAPLHWSLAFPEVFDPDRAGGPGFDAIVGNPPFLAGVRISRALSRTYLDYLRARYPGGGGQADLVAYFLRRAYALLRPGGALGLLATNTVAQGDTREAGLEPLCCGRGIAWGLVTVAPPDAPAPAPATIYAAERRIRWPGDAVVLVSAVHMTHGPCTLQPTLDGRPVARVTALLLPEGGHAGPARLRENAGRAFKGLEPYADGFVFEDGNPGANPTAVMRALIAGDPRRRARIFPYLGGQELNHAPTLAPSRYVIHFEDMSLEEAGRWPALLRLVERRVKPFRAGRAPAVARWPWWRFWRDRPELREATRGLETVLALADTSKHLAIARVPARYVLNKTLVVIALASDAGFAVLQSRAHELWARRFGSSMKDDLRYTASDCFDTFPFPPAWERDAALSEAGRAYDERRGALMRARACGLTRLYNAFHDPDARDPEIAALRRLHAALDDAALRAYGWSDLAEQACCEFRERYAVERAGGRRRPWRLQWPAALQREVLARLLALNQARARQGDARRVSSTTSGR